MKKFIPSVILFSIIAFLCYIGFTVIFGLVLPSQLTKNLNYRIGSKGFLNTKVKEIEEAKDIDILVLGSSRTYRGFDPRIFKKNGFTMFNLGSSAQTPMQTELLVKRYLLKINPKLVIFEVSPGNFNSDGIESTTDLISNMEIGADLLKLASRLNHLKAYNTLIYAYFRNIFKMDANFVEESVHGTDKYVHNGYVQNTLTKNDFKKLYKSSKRSMRREQKEAFERIVAFLEDHSTEVVFVQAPMTNYRYQAATNNSEIDEYFKKFGEYYNFNNLISLSDEYDFSDSHHLSQTGVNKFNRYLIETFIKEGIIQSNYLGKIQ